MEVTGKIIHIGETEVVGSAGTFKKRLIVVETEEQYKQQIPVDFTQDKCSILDNYSVNQEVKISINIRGNKHNDKWYCGLQGWRIEKTAEPVPPSQAYVNNQQPSLPNNTSAVNEDEEDDLAF